MEDEQLDSYIFHFRGDIFYFTWIQLHSFFSEISFTMILSCGQNVKRFSTFFMYFIVKMILLNKSIFIFLRFNCYIEVKSCSWIAFQSIIFACPSLLSSSSYSIPNLPLHSSIFPSSFSPTFLTLLLFHPKPSPSFLDLSLRPSPLPSPFLQFPHLGSLILYSIQCKFLF